jgi:hypothetical protein
MWGYEISIKGFGIQINSYFYATEYYTRL